MSNIGKQPSDATDALLGYLHQVLVGLDVLLENEGASIRVESLDDLTLFEDNEPVSLLQVKHHSRPASLTNSSREIWKTLSNWCDQIDSQPPGPEVIFLHLITTATAPPGSAAAHLRQGHGRDVKEARRLLLNVVEQSKSTELRTKYFPAFTNLSEADQLEVLARISIADRSPDITELLDSVSQRLNIATFRERRRSLVERVEGWWLERVVRNLRNPADQIPGRELFDHVARTAEQLRPDSLPTDFFDSAPSQEQKESLLERQFVGQLRAISISTRRIEIAVADYYKAFEQRSRWVREELLVDGELDRYESRLAEEWERFRLSLEDEEDMAHTSEGTMQELGRRVLNWMEQVADVRIRPPVDAPYVMRGSYHMLADKKPPEVWWHPKFLERLEVAFAKGDAE